MMSPMSLQQVADCVAADPVGDAMIGRVCTDTRAIRGGDLFVALSGEHFDGNDFVEQAKQKGAVAAVVSRQPNCELPHVQVRDTQKALGLIALHNRRQFTGKLVALTGSAGKTSCKEMLAAMLSLCGETLATEGNLNNEIGVPLTLLKIATEHRFAVVEMGAAKAGDIAYLCDFVEADIAVLTNAMAAHIEGFGSLDQVARTKGEIFEGLVDGGLAVINADSPYAEQWHRQAKNKQVLTFSLENPGADFFAKQIQLSAECGSVFVLSTPQGEVTVELALLGRHNIANAIAASAAATAAGASLQQVAAGLKKVRPVAGRLHTRKAEAGFAVIDDSYNANPGAVKAAIDVLVEFSGQRYLVLGDMAELGDDSARLHREVGAYAKQQGVDTLLALGEFSESLVEGFGKNAKAFTSKQTLIDYCQSLDAVDVMLVKGSRSAGMEQLVEALCSQTTNCGDAATTRSH
jgi:UDP-N-acetylmuramoyl-tripeptide--D-alanyl-D-alanine ligase